MKKGLMSAGLAAIGCIVAAAVAAEEYTTTTTYDPVLEAYRYDAPPNTWYAAKIKPKHTMSMAPKTPVSAQTWSVPKAGAEPVAYDTTADSPTTDVVIANLPVAKSPESTDALPFWQDISPR